MLPPSRGSIHPRASEPSILAPLAAKVLVLADDRTLETIGGVRLVLDAQPHAGVLPSVAQGLAAARGEVGLVAASDMPFVSRAAFEHLLAVQRRLAADVVIPRIGGMQQPMHMVVRRAPALRAVRAALAKGEQRLFRALLAVQPYEVEADKLRALDPELRTVFNLNTPNDLVEARRMAHEQAAAPSGSPCPVHVAGHELGSPTAARVAPAPRPRAACATLRAGCVSP